MKHLAVNQFSRIVVKIGSSLLVEGDSGVLRRDWLAGLVAELAELHRAGKTVLIVSSGAIALGRGIAKIPSGKLKLEDGQAAAAIGQIELSRVWSELLAEQGLLAAQVLLTLDDTEQRRRYLNARSTITRLFAYHAVPIINENDTVATEEIRYGDNDRLAARVAVMSHADCLVLLSDIDGLYTRPPKEGGGERLERIDTITEEIEAMASDAGSELSRGGMRTKVEAGKIATSSGCHMVIASGHEEKPLSHIDQGGACTWFLPAGNPASARKAWIAGTLHPEGTITIDEGAARALHQGRSLLPAGVTEVHGEFERGDTIAVLDLSGKEIARGLVAYDSAEAQLIAGARSKDLEALLGFTGRAELIHRDDLALL